ncbi:hypothetical protein EUX98_g1059 [Antrodiella citrinella]|uniref:Uncharacterized protein n=1 Tax=Antrodiella citrinella TaxID=2447956 RepID=A0A4S4N5B8_9APHY|nr:hypothetical protein EUX98_g1059 [Antrodiella citrinella]
MSTAAGTQSDARFETSAAWAEAEASNAKLATQVEQNAHQLHNAAEDAATTAQYKSPAAAVNNLEHGLSDKTEEAVAEGQDNVQDYVARAKSLANSAISTAQSYLPAGTTVAGTAGSVQATAGSALQTTKEYLVQAQHAAAPVANQALNAGLAAAETARTTAAPYMQSATDAVSRAVQGDGSSHPNSVAPTTASLESGPHVVDSPYSAPNLNGQNPKVGEV